MTARRGLRVAMLALVGTAVLSATAIAQVPFPRRDDRGTVQRDRRDPRDTRGTGTIWDRRTTGRYDLAFNTGENDGYKDGLKDGEKGDRFDPTREKKYRSATSGYDKRYGSKEAYKDRYRDGYRRGYQLGYDDGRRYDRRDPRNRNNRDNRNPGWWPFGR